MHRVLVLLTTAGGAAAQSSGNDRSLSSAVQNINGMSSIFSLIPVLTGKVQNIKLVAARIFPGALTFAGLGAGRVLSKLQVGVLLLSCDLYRNLVGEFSYHHNEYVNKFSPALIHVPTGTPERHSSNVIINHNPTEDYMIETWFQTQGRPARVELRQSNNQRTLVGVLIYVLIYALETFLGVRTAATSTGLVLVIMQVVAAACWIGAICALQVNRGQGKRFVDLNRLDSPEYRCFQLVVLGKHVQSAVFSIHISNVKEFNIFRSDYENKTLKIVGGAILASGSIDVIATILLVGLNSWAYGWLAYQITIVFVKVVFSLEPLRQIAIKDVQPMSGHPRHPLQDSPKVRLPLIVCTVPEFVFLDVCIGKNIVLEHATKVHWQSRTPGLFIGQPYYSTAKNGSTPEPPVRYLALADGKLTLDVIEPQKEGNQALQREYLACLGEVTKANKVASWEFILAVEATMQGVRRTMNAEWYAFGTKDIAQYLQRCKDDITWRNVI